MDNEIKVSVVIVNWNTRELLKQCLKSVYAETSVPAEIFVVDNASGDGSAEMVRANFPRVCLIANSDNKGFAAANNQAINRTQGQYVLLLNPDTKVLGAAIDKLAAYLDDEETVGACTGKLLNGDGSLQKNVGNFYSFWSTLFENRILPAILPNSKFLAKRLVAFWDHATSRDIDWARGAVLLVRKKVLDRIGFLDERFYIYGEEIDLCWRIKQYGWRIIYLPEAEIIHYGKASSSQRRKEMFIQNYKSFYLFLKKHYPGYSYFFYRLRVMLYFIPWFLKILFTLFFFPANSQKKQDAKGLLDIYLASLRWHLSKDSLIKI